MAQAFERIAVTKDWDEAAWHAERRKGIGGSDAAAALGLSRHQSPAGLWLVKTGAVEPDDLSEVQEVEWGIRHEPTVAQAYADKHPGVTVRRVNAVLASKKHPFMRCNVDREIVDPKRGRGVLEVKTTRYGSMYDDGAPIEHLTQCLHNLVVTGWDFVDLAVLIGGSDYREYEVVPNTDFMSKMVKGEAAFWRHVTDGTMPDLVGHEDEAKVLLAMYPEAVPGEVKDLSGNDAVARALIEYEVSKKAEADAKSRKEAAANVVRLAMGEAGKAIFADSDEAWKVSWSRFVTNRVDMDALKADHADVVARYTTPTPSQRLTITSKRDD